MVEQLLTKKPTQYTNKEFYEEALAQSYASPEGDVPIPPPSELVSRDYGPKPPQKLFRLLNGLGKFEALILQKKQKL